MFLGHIQAKINDYTVQNQSLFRLHPCSRRKIRHIEVITKCRHLKLLTCKGTLRQVFIRVIDKRNSQSCWHFRPCLVNYCFSNLLSGSTLPPFPLPCVKVQHILTMCGWKGAGVVQPCWRPYSAGV
jgi:hypothetical protein